MKDWIKTLNKEKKKILSNEKKQNKALENLNHLFDENEQLKQNLKAERKANRETVEKIKRLKTAQIVQYKRERDETIKKLQEQKKQIKKSIKSHPITRQKEILNVKNYQKEGKTFMKTLNLKQ